MFVWGWNRASCTVIDNILRALRALPFVPQAMLDVLRTPGLTAGAFPTPATARRAHDRLRAVSILVRIADMFRAPVGCRRKAFAYCRALARSGVPARLRFGIREARPDEECGGGYVGHVWASAAPGGAEPGKPCEYLAVAEVPGAQLPRHWRRG